MTRPKDILGLVLDGTWRRDRHLILFDFDFSLLEFLEHSVDRGLVEISDADRLRLEWCWYWQAALHEGVHPDVALHWFVRAIRGDHPPRLPDGMENEA